MKFTSILTPIALAGTVLADGAAITSALKTIDSSIKSLTGQLSSFKGTTIFDAVPIGLSTLKLNSDIQAGTKAANASQPLTSDETVGLADVTSVIITDATACIDALIAVKPQFDKITFVTPATSLFVSTLQKSTASLGDAIVAKVPADFKAVAQQLIDQINAQFVRALNAYGGSGGGLPGGGLPGGGLPGGGLPGGSLPGGGLPGGGFPGAGKGSNKLPLRFAA